MAKWGKADYKQLIRLRDKAEKLSSIDMDVFCRQIAKEIAARLISSAKSRTQVISGDLRRGWQTDGNVVYRGNEYRITVFNPTPYAIYVEYGHRTSNGSGWVKGSFILEISSARMQDRMDAIIEKRLLQKLMEVFND